MKLTRSFNKTGGYIIKDIKVLGVDLAKDVFQLHGTDAKGNRVLTKRLSRVKLVDYMANTRPCLVGIEACGGAHYWARVFEAHGHNSSHDWGCPCHRAGSRRLYASFLSTTRGAKS